MVDRKDLKGLSLDGTDRKNIMQAIYNYEIVHPGEIASVIIQARNEVLTSRASKLNKKADGVTFRLAMPLGLKRYLMKNYPSLIVDRGQFEQFLKWFPDFDLLKR